jgi:hypothetical protein
MAVRYHRATAGGGRGCEGKEDHRGEGGPSRATDVAAVLEPGRRDATDRRLAHRASWCENYFTEPGAARASTSGPR